MNCKGSLRRLTGLLLCAALLMVPLADHAGSAEADEAGVPAALAITCLDLEDRDAGDTGYDAHACPGCPLGCSGGWALACSGSVAMEGSRRDLIVKTAHAQSALQVVLEAGKARSPPVV